MRRLILAFFLASCTTAVPATTSTRPLLPPPSVTAPPLTPPPALTIEHCTRTPPVPFAVLCDAVAKIEAHHLEPPSRLALAAAARLGLTELPISGATGSFTCVVPSREFEELCAEIAVRRAGRDLELLVDQAVSGMFRYSLDPFSSYLPASLVARLGDLGPGQVPSLGLIVGGLSRTGEPCGSISDECRLTILVVLGFTPADTAGLAVGDAIVEIDGEPVIGMSPDAASALLVGEAGTATAVSVERFGRLVTKTLIHDEVRSHAVEYGVIDRDVAYLRVNDFSQRAAELVGEVLSSDELGEARALILDLRDNPGGLVLSAQAVASQFLVDGLVMRETTRSGGVEWPVLQGGLATADLPLVVLVNRGTASAAEVVAAVLQERGRALVIGERTFGKDLVQQVFETRRGGEMRITTSRWTTPRGDDVRGGIQPDIEVAGSDPAEPLAAALAHLGR